MRKKRHLNLLFNHIKKNQRFNNYNTDTNIKQHAKTQKWCSYHKLSSHSDTECKAQQKQNNAMIFEKQETNKELMMPIKVDDTEGSALFDTGASKSCISTDFFKKLNIETTQNKKTTIILANGQEITPSINCEISFRIDQLDNCNFKWEFVVVDGLNFDLILGTDFLISTKSVIDLSAGTISIDGQYVLLFDQEIDAAESQAIERLNRMRVSNKIIEDFKSTNPELGLIPNREFTIETKENNIINPKQYSVPTKFEPEVRKHLSELLSLGIIRHSSGRWNSPAFPIFKKNGEIRLVIDYRALNEITESRFCPIPNISEEFFNIGGASVFSQIDLRMGYHQIRISDKDSQKTAFTIMGRKYEYTRMPFGLKNAPFEFQEAVNNILLDIECVKVYLDDVLVFSPNDDTHENDLRNVLTKLKENNISINFNKSTFFAKQVIFLGQKISKSGIKPDLSPRDKLTDSTIPNNKKAVMRIIGIIQWFRPYIVGLSSKIKPISDLLQKKSTFSWTNEHKTILSNIVDEIKDSKGLKFPDFNIPFSIYTDASDNGCGGVIRQNEDIIGIYSKKFSNTERKYSIVEREFLAIILTLNKFRKLLLGNKIFVYTDNLNILGSPKSQSNRISRWSWIISDFNLTVRHIRSEDNQCADGISRLHNIKHSSTSQKDEGIQNFTIQIKDSKNITEISEKLIKMHNLLGHPGPRAFLKTVKPSLPDTIRIQNKDIMSVSSNCIDCQRSKHHNIKYGHTFGIVHSNEPLEIISSDICGPFNVVKNKQLIKIFVITITDLCTRYTLCRIVRTTDSKTLISAFKLTWLRVFHPPAKLIADRGSQYTSQSFKAFMNSRGVSMSYCSPNNATGNAKSERINRQINEIFRISYMKDINFKTLEQLMFRRLNLVFHRAIDTSPYVLMFGLNPLDGTVVNNKDILLEKANKRTLQQNREETHKRNSKRKDYLYTPESQVFVKNRTSVKQEPIWKGPFRVIKSDRNRIMIEAKYGSKFVNVKNVRPFIELKVGQNVGSPPLSDQQIMQ